MKMKENYFEKNDEFIVTSIEKHNANNVKINVVFANSTKEYTYIRQIHLDVKNIMYFSVINGWQICYRKHAITEEYIFEGYHKQYDTKGHKKVNGGTKANKEIENIEQPAKEETEEKIVKYEENPKHAQYETIKTCLEANIPIYLAGPAGSGKNYTVEQICKELGWEFYFSNSVQQEYKLTGFIDAGGDYHETEFYKACTSNKPCVFFLDEIDASIPEVLVLLNAAIANGYFEFPTGRVELTNVKFVAAGNTVGSGADDMYTGRMVIDQATLDRFAIIDFDYDKNIELSLAKGNIELVNFVRELRKQANNEGIRVTFSYRCLIMVTKLEKAKMPLMQILKITVFKGLDKDTINTFKGMAFNKYGKVLEDMKVA